jgi:hypothetical protein
VNIVPAFLRRRPVFEGDQHWAKRIPQMRMEESMTDVERAIQQMRRGDFLEAQAHPRDLGPIPETPDLFADGLEIAQQVLDWEERAGQPIAPLIDHIKAAQELRKSVTAKASGDAKQEPAS